jgi:hypothetical protein
MERLKARAERLKSSAQETMRLREGPEYQKAMEVLGDDLGSEEGMANLKLTFTPEAAEAISSGG